MPLTRVNKQTAELNLKPTLDNTSLLKSVNTLTKSMNKAVQIDGKHIQSLSRPLGKITGQADEFSRSMAASNARVIAFGASVAIIGGVTKAFKDLLETTIRVEKTFADINVVLGANRKELKQFGDGIFKVAKQTAQSFDIVAEGALEFARQGLGMEESLKRIKDALILTRLTGLDVTESVMGLTAAVNAFRDTGITTTQVINKLAEVDVKFAVGSEDLIKSIERAGSIAQDTGVTFEELTAMTTALQQTTARGGAVIGNSLKSIFSRIRRNETLEALRRINIEITDLDGNLLSSTKLLKNLADRLKDDVKPLSDLGKQQIFQKVGGLFQINQLIALLGDLSREQGIYSEALVTAQVESQKAFEKNEQLNQTIDATIKKTGIAITQIASMFGNIGFQDGVRDILNAINIVFDFLLKTFDEENGSKLAKAFIKGFGGALTSVPVLGLIGGIILKLTADLAKFGVVGLKSLFGMNKAAQQQKALQESVISLLIQQPQILQEINKFQNSRVAGERIVLGVVTRTAEQYERMAKAARSVTPGLFAAGVRTGERGLVPSAGTPRLAGGYIPNAALGESENIRRGIGGARPTSQPVRVDNFNFGGGKRGSIVANTDEYIVKNFAGSGGSAVFNQDMVRNLGMPKGARRIAPNVAGGYIPNFAFVRGAKLTSEFKKYQAGELSRDEYIGRYGQLAFNTRQRALETGMTASKREALARKGRKPQARLAKSSVALNMGGRVGMATALGGAPNPSATVQTTLGNVVNKVDLGMTGLSAKTPVNMTGLQVGTVSGLMKYGKAKENQFRKMIEGEFARPTLNLAKRIIPDEVDRIGRQATDINRILAQESAGNLLSTSAEGSIFESATRLAVRSLKKSKSFYTGSETAPFDYDAKVSLSKSFKDAFGFTGALQKADAKRSDSSGDRIKIIRKTLRDLDFRGTLQKEGALPRGLAGGYVPNFASSNLLFRGIARSIGTGRYGDATLLGGRGFKGVTVQPKSRRPIVTKKAHPDYDSDDVLISDYMSRAFSAKYLSGGGMEFLKPLGNLKRTLQRKYGATFFAGTTMSDFAGLSSYAPPIVALEMIIEKEILRRFQASPLDQESIIRRGGIGGSPLDAHGGNYAINERLKSRLQNILRTTDTTRRRQIYQSLLAQLHKPSGPEKFIKKITAGGGNIGVFDAFHSGLKRSSLREGTKHHDIKGIEGVFAGGHIPNFNNPLNDAIERERNAGVPINQIRINQDGKLRNAQNPQGLAVTNMRDEPTGSIPNFQGGGIKDPSGNLTNIRKLQKATKNVGSVTDSMNNLGQSTKKLTSLTDMQSKGVDNSIGKIFALQTVLFGVSAAFSNVEDGVETFGSRLTRSLSEVTSALISLSLITSQFGGLGGKPTGASSGLASFFGRTGLAFSAARRGEKTFRIPKGQAGAGQFASVGKSFGGQLGKGVTAVGGSFTKLLPVVGQVIFGFQALNALSRLFPGGKSLMERFFKSTDQASKGLINFSKDISGISSLSSLRDRIGEERARIALERRGGKPLENIESQQRELDFRRFQSGFDADEFFGFIPEKTKEIQKRISNARSTFIETGGAFGGEERLEAKEELTAIETAKGTVGKIYENLERNLFGISEALKNEKDPSKKLATEAIDSLIAESRTSLQGILQALIADLQAGDIAPADFAQAVRETLLDAQENNLDRLNKAIQEKINEEVFKIERGELIFFDEFRRRIDNVFTRRGFDLSEGAFFGGVQARQDQNSPFNELAGLRGERELQTRLATEPVSKLQRLEIEQELTRLNQAKAFAQEINKIQQDQVLSSIKHASSLETIGDATVSSFEQRIMSGEDLTEIVNELVKLTGTELTNEKDLDETRKQQLATLNESLKRTQDDERVARERYNSEVKIRKEREKIARLNITPKGFDKSLGQGFANLKDESDLIFDQLGNRLPFLFRDGMVDAMQAAFNGSEDLRTNLMDIAKGFLLEIQRAFLQDAAGATVNFVKGLIPGQATGGMVTGGSGIRDDVPRLLMGGEYVIRKDAVNKYGPNFLDSLNQGSVPTFATGDFFVPGFRGQGEIKGKKDLLAFASQRTTSGSQDIFKSGRGFASINLEEQSRRLSVFGRTREDSPFLQHINDAQAEAMGLLDQKADYERQKKEAKKQAKKELIQMVISTAIMAAVSTGIGQIQKGIDNNKAAKGLSAAYGEKVTAKDVDMFVSKLPASQREAFLNNAINFGSLSKGNQALAKGAAGGISSIAGKFQNPQQWLGGSKTAIGNLLKSSFPNIASGDFLDDVFDVMKKLGSAPELDVPFGAHRLNLNNFSTPTSGGSPSGRGKRANSGVKIPSGGGGGGPFQKRLEDAFPGFASGGFSGRGQNVLTMGGEYIMNPQAVDTYGREFFERINNMTAPMPRFANGGSVSGAPAQTSIDSSGDTNISIVVNSDGSSGGSSDARSANEQDARMADRIKKEVVRIIGEEKRISGELSSRRRGF
jgi:TP901 family phage tail tape measure protein